MYDAKRPRPRRRIHDRREAVQSKQDRLPPSLGARLDLLRYSRMIGRENLSDPRGFRGVIQTTITRYGGAVAGLGNRLLCIWRTVAIDHQPRIALADEGAVEPPRKVRAQAGDADVPSDVTLKIVPPQAQIAQARWDRATGVIPQKQNGRGAA